MATEAARQFAEVAAPAELAAEAAYRHTSLIRDALKLGLTETQAEKLAGTYFALPHDPSA